MPRRFVKGASERASATAKRGFEQGAGPKKRAEMGKSEGTEVDVLSIHDTVRRERRKEKL